MGWIEVFGDLRAMTGLMVAALGAIFMAFAHRESWPYVRWMAGSALMFGLLQLANRLFELARGVSTVTTGIIAPLLVVPCIVALMIGLYVYLRPAPRHVVRRFWALSAAGVLWSLLITGLMDAHPLRGPIATATMLSLSAAWLMWEWWRDRWSGQLVLAAALMVHPALVVAAHSAGLDVVQFRQLTPLPIVLVYLFLMTLILQRDARLLARELKERERAEGELKQLASALDQKVRERTARLEEINQGLRTFSGMVSHDLRGPLRNIHGMSELARESIEQGQPALALPMVRKVGHEALRASRMVGDLLSLAQADQQQLQKADVDFTALVQQCVARLAQEYPCALAQVRVDALPVVPADAGLMEHVVLNLVGNALKYGHAVPDLQVHVRAQRDDGGEGAVWRFSVSDNGPGFDPARTDELFKPFRRLVDAQVPGTGLGLTVVRRAVRQHGGQVGASAAPGEGAIFWWTLPAA